MPSTRQPDVEVLPPLGGKPKGDVDPLLEELSDWMDAKFEIPGTGIRFGLDPLLGLIPGLGDTLTALLSAFILSAAVQRGVPRITMARMGLNIGIDFLLGAVPLVGDLFDVAWKANLKNMELLRRSTLAPDHEARRGRLGDWLFVGGMMLGLLALLVLAISTAWYLLSLLAANAPRLF